MDDGSGDWGTVTVPGVTIDQLARDYGSPDVLFVDVEGYECQALRGAVEVLSHRPDCCVEVHVQRGLELLGGSVDEVLSFFENYSLYVATTSRDRQFRKLESSRDLPSSMFFLVALSG